MHTSLMIDGTGLLVFAVVVRYFGRYNRSVKLATFFLVVGIAFNYALIPHIVPMFVPFWGK